jgi:hypothetical protein
MLCTITIYMYIYICTASMLHAVRFRITLSVSTLRLIQTVGGWYYLSRLSGSKCGLKWYRRSVLSVLELGGSVPFGRYQSLLGRAARCEEAIVD